MRKSNLGNLAIIVSLILTIIVWIVFPPVNDGRENFIRQYVGEIIGSINIVLMSFSLLISARPKWAEPYFGGLDKMYVAHRRTSTAAFLLILVHVLTVPISLDWKLGNYLAVIAFLGIVPLALISLAPRIPWLGKLAGNSYERWKKLKRFIGVYFIIAFVHSLTVPHPLEALIAISWVQVFFIIGLVSYLYTELFGRFFKKYLPYTVEAVNRPNNSTTEILMRAKKDSLQNQRAGQFLFVRFPTHPELDESHPFTISSAPRADLVRVTVKASGDFTRALFAHLQPGTDAVIEGPYGMFDYKTGGAKQIWIAGGIGLTPFLSFLRGMDGSLDRDIHFYYCVRHPEEVLFQEELEAAAQKNPRLKLHIRCSSKDGSLTIEQILADAGSDAKGHHVYLCGPLPMTQAFESKFLALGVPQEQIHYEEFNFR
ncbi:MAG: ferric reductase-like transmembrane domain-containing protein [Chloroflexi bacterium]|nr:ferric reductase-like transmembrane domain-containing protein [Chloroflexota bacterium]